MKPRSAQNADASTSIDDRRVRARALTLDARARWPGVRLTAEAFSKSAGARVDSPHATDLYLAIACLHGDAAAWAYLERDYLAPIERRLERAVPGPMGAEIYDLVRRSLLPDPERSSLLSTYAGRSTLGTWIGGVARRKKLETIRLASGRRARATTNARVARVSPVDPEFDYMRRHFSRELKAALTEVLESLSHSDRELLRKQLLGGETVDRVGRRMGVHRATAARRIARIRERVKALVHARLAKRLGLDADEAKSLSSLVGDSLGLSLTRILAK